MENNVGIGNAIKINNELKIVNQSGDWKVFLQGGFYRNNTICDYIHVHNYTEVHLVSDGEIVFSIGQEKIAVNESIALVIPGGMYHGYVSKTEGAQHTAFQIDHHADAPFTHKMDESLTRYLFAEIAKTEPTGDLSSVASVLALLCTQIFPDSPLLAHYVTDAGYLITNFFSQSYKNDVKLRDLAEILHLSERQTERLVEELTGRCFRDELTLTRMHMAEQLFTTTDMLPTHVAQYVGYRSYPGFWKAYTKYKASERE